MTVWLLLQFMSLYFTEKWLEILSGHSLWFSLDTHKKVAVVLYTQEGFKVYAQTQNGL